MPLTPDHLRTLTDWGDIARQIRATGNAEVRDMETRVYRYHAHHIPVGAYGDSVKVVYARTAYSVKKALYVCGEHAVRWSTEPLAVSCTPPGPREGVLLPRTAWDFLLQRRVRYLIFRSADDLLVADLHEMPAGAVEAIQFVAQGSTQIAIPLSFFTRPARPPAVAVNQAQTALFV